MLLPFFMHKPDYSNCIVNLMGSVLRGQARLKNSVKLPAPLRQLPPSEFKEKNTLVMIIDGLGYDFLKRHARGSFMVRHLKSKITSVFPSTTASAITSFFTGEVPAEHGSTGWFIWLKELGCVVKILPFEARCSDIPLSFDGLYPYDFIRGKSVFDKVNVKCCIVNRKHIIDSDSSIKFFGEHAKFPYTNLNGFFRQMKTALKGDEKKLVMSYWPEFDTLAHKKGINHRDTINHFWELDSRLEKLSKSVKNTKIIITADHGVIDSSKKKIIHLKKHPKLNSMLRIPLCGEPRLVYCYVKSGMEKAFEDYTSKLDWCDCFLSKNLVDKNFFGKGKNPHFLDRIGDYCLIMKENYALVDNIAGEEIHKLVGFHGGASSQEMYVPLIIV